MMSSGSPSVSENFLATCSDGVRIPLSTIATKPSVTLAFLANCTIEMSLSFRKTLKLFGQRLV